jgi:hypothetical protein
LAAAAIGAKVTPVCERTKRVVDALAKVQGRLAPDGGGPVQTYRQSLHEHQDGDGVDLSLVKARGAERHGLIWLLAASTVAAIAAMAGIVLLNYPSLTHLM